MKKPIIKNGYYKHSALNTITLEITSCSNPQLLKRHIKLLGGTGWTFCHNYGERWLKYPIKREETK